MSKPINEKYSHNIKSFLANTHNLMPYLSSDISSELIEQMGGEAVFIKAFKLKADMDYIKEVKGLNDTADLQSFYHKHREALQIFMDRCFIGDPLLSIVHTTIGKVVNNNTHLRGSLCINNIAKGLYDRDIADNSSDDKFLLGARVICRIAVLSMLERYNRFLVIDAEHERLKAINNNAIIFDTSTFSELCFNYIVIRRINICSGFKLL